jgi:hypothetical protein
MRNLSTVVRPTRDQGKVSVEFTSDFALPDLPTPPPAAASSR